MQGIVASSHQNSAVISALAFTDVSFAYGSQPVVEKVSATLAEREMVALLGPNGAGKSTLLRLASGVLRPASGRIFVAGADVRRVSRREMARRVAVVPQEFVVPFAYTVRQIVAMGRLAHADRWGSPRAGDRAAVEAALAETNTAVLADRIFNDLSGGERQRTLIALALAQASPLLLLDEPTAHLDIKHQIETLELLRRLNRERGLTVLAVLHDLNLAARFFPRLLLFRHRILADGPPARVLDAALLSRVYETPVQVGILRGGEHLSVLPPAHMPNGASARADGAPPAPQVHVLAGGGTGALLMQALADAGTPFSAGPLPVGDSDHALAERLAVKLLASPPYAPISPELLAEARRQMSDTGVVIVCPAPLAEGNIALLDAALEVARAGGHIILLEPATDPVCGADALLDRVAARDQSGLARERYRALLAADAKVAASPVDALELLPAR